MSMNSATAFTGATAAPPAAGGASWDASGEDWAAAAPAGGEWGAATTDAKTSEW